MSENLAQARAIIHVSLDDGKTWSPVLPSSVPEWVKAPDVMANLLHGEMAQSKSFKAVWYRAERLPPEAPPETLQ